jgi:membrane protein
MKASATDLGSIAVEAGSRWVDDACYRLGASLAYYAVFSIFPLALLAVTVVGFLLGNDDSVRQRVLDWVASAATPESRALLDQTLQSMQTHRTERGIGSVVGIVTLIFGASGVFSELESALDLVWRVKTRPSAGFWSSIVRAVRDKALSFVVVGATAIALLTSLIATTALGAIGAATSRWLGVTWLWWPLEALVSLALLTLLLGSIYRMIPHAPVLWRDVLGGAFVTSLLLVALKYLLALYLERLGGYAAYGAVGAVLGLLMWIYLAGLILLYGAELGRVYAERFGSLRAAKPLNP